MLYFNIAVTLAKRCAITLDKKNAKEISLNLIELISLIFINLDVHLHSHFLVKLTAMHFEPDEIFRLWSYNSAVSDGRFVSITDDAASGGK